MLHNLLLLEKSFDIQISLSYAEVVDSQLCFEESHFIITIATAFIILSFTVTILLVSCVCCCHFACKTCTLTRRKTINDQNGHNTSASAQPLQLRRTETDRENSLENDDPDSSKYDSLADELRQLCTRKLEDPRWKKDQHYQTCLVQLHLLSWYIRAKKELPTTVPQISCGTDAPQSEESFPEMDELPLQFRSIVFYYCQHLGITWKKSADDENEEPYPRAADNENEKTDIIAAETENKNNDQVETSKM